MKASHLLVAVALSLCAAIQSDADVLTELQSTVEDKVKEASEDPALRELFDALLLDVTRMNYYRGEKNLSMPADLDELIASYTRTVKDVDPNKFDRVKHSELTEIAADVHIKAALFTDYDSFRIPVNVGRVYHVCYYDRETILVGGSRGISCIGLERVTRDGKRSFVFKEKWTRPSSEATKLLVPTPLEKTVLYGDSKEVAKFDVSSGERVWSKSVERQDVRAGRGDLIAMLVEGTMEVRGGREFNLVGQMPKPVPKTEMGGLMTALAFANKADYLAIGRGKRGLEIWDFKSNQVYPLTVPRPYSPEPFYFVGTAFAADDKTMYAISRDGRLASWYLSEMSKWEFKDIIRGDAQHDAWEFDVTFDGKRIAVCSGGPSSSEVDVIDIDKKRTLSRVALVS